MKPYFNVEFTGFQDNAFSKLGVFSNIVKAPDPCICKKGDKPFLRLFYVTKGSIIFDENTDKTLCAKAGDIVFCLAILNMNPNGTLKRTGNILQLTLCLIFRI